MQNIISDSTPHGIVQREAIDAGLKILHEDDRPRARFAMACGTGKTITQLRLCEALIAAKGIKHTRILVLVPSLSLIRQSRDEWAQHHKLITSYDSMCVCSDPYLKQGTAGVLQDLGEDHIELSAEDLAALGIDEATTSAQADIARINRWLDARESVTGSPNVSVIFTTYQSARVVGMAMTARKSGNQRIDLGIFDEAHRTAGAIGKPFSYALSDANIAISKRMYFTATERIRQDARRSEEETVVTMDDEAIYGPRAYFISARQAAERGLIAPIQVIISVIRDRNIAEQVQKNRIVIAADGRSIHARSVANLGALARAMRNFGLSKAITFHGSVDRALEFAAISPTVASSSIDLQLLHISGRQSNSQRAKQMRLYEAAQRPTVISNARCLTEGVNVPATDIVAFMDPKKGAIDIVQAIGRVQRRAPGKKMGYVLLPLHVNIQDGETEQAAIDKAAKDFKQIRQVLAALADNDDAFQEQIREAAATARFAGYDDAADVFTGLPVMLLIDGNGDEVKANQLAHAIKTRILHQLVGDFDSRWDTYFDALANFKASNGHCNVPVSHITTDDLPLGKWLSDQRQQYRSGIFHPVRLRRMSRLGVEWNPQSNNWNKHFDALAEYAKQHGNCSVPKTHITPSGLKLAAWLDSQCRAYRKGAYPSERQEKLEKLGVIWSPNDAEWERRFIELNHHVKSTGSAVIPVSPEHRVLYNWMHRQTRTFLEGAMKDDRRARLAALGLELFGATNEPAEAEAEAEQISETECQPQVFRDVGMASEVSPQVPPEKAIAAPMSRMLMEIPEIASAMGFSEHQVRRFLKSPPQGFPDIVVRVGVRIYVKRIPFIAWLHADT